MSWRGRWIAAAGALLLAGSLWLTWSHERTPALVRRFGAGPVLAGVPAAADAWQVYAASSFVLLALAGAIAAAGWRGGRTTRLTVGLLALLAVAFVAHALASPPTAGLALATGSPVPRYLPDLATSGAGEPIALLALALALAGLAAGPGLASQAE